MQAKEFEAGEHAGWLARQLCTAAETHLGVVCQIPRLEAVREWHPAQVAECLPSHPTRLAETLLLIPGFVPCPSVHLLFYVGIRRTIDPTGSTAADAERDHAGLF